MSRPLQDLQVGRTITWNGKLYLVTHLDVEQKNPAGPGLYSTTIKALLYSQLDPAIYKAKPPRARAAKSKPAAKTTPKARGWRKMSTAPLGTPIEVRFKTDGTSFADRTVTAKLDEHGLWIGKVYWARFNALGQDRLDDWRHLSK